MLTVIVEIFLQGGTVKSKLDLNSLLKAVKNEIGRILSDATGEQSRFLLMNGKEEISHFSRAEHIPI